MGTCDSAERMTFPRYKYRRAVEIIGVVLDYLLLLFFVPSAPYAPSSPLETKEKKLHSAPTHAPIVERKQTMHIPASNAEPTKVHDDIQRRWY
jgi:hypothetical protein